MRIAVVGAGNIGTQFAGICASKGHIVTVHSSKPELIEKTLEIVDENNIVTQGVIECATDDYKTAISGNDVIFVTHPAFQLKETAEKMLPYIHEGMKICVLPGTGGAEFAFRDCIQAGAVLLGLQRVPAVARLERYGKRVKVEGLRNTLHLASIPSAQAFDFALFLEELFDIPCVVLPNYLSVTLTPSNPILHTTRLKTLFDDYKIGTIYDRNPLFYGEWCDKSSELLFACDEELQQICRMIDNLDLNNVRSLKLHYESDTVEALTYKISSIKSLHNLPSPMQRVDGGWIPDFKSRYFTADFPYGLAIIAEIAKLLDYDAHNIKQTLAWYQSVTDNKTAFKLCEYDIFTISDLCRLYLA